MQVKTLPIGIKISPRYNSQDSRNSNFIPLGPHNEHNIPGYHATGESAIGKLATMDLGFMTALDSIPET